MRVWAALAILIAITGCGRRAGVDPHLDEAYPDKLSGWGLFRAKAEPADRVAAYDVRTPLFSDYAAKRRTVWMPEGQQAGYRGTGVFEFPAGTVLTKTFSFPQKDGAERLIETRLLVRQRSGWIALVYVWNRDQTDAVLDPNPEPVPVRWVDAAGSEHSTTYEIPNVNQCTTCHSGGNPLGPVASNVKLEQWTAAYYVKGAPAQPKAGIVWDDPRTGSLDERARAYIDVNCSSCHREGTRAKPLFPSVDRREMLRRMETLDENKRMPTLGHTVLHREAIALMRKWAEAPD